MNYSLLYITQTIFIVKINTTIFLYRFIKIIYKKALYNGYKKQTFGSFALKCGDKR